MPDGVSELLRDDENLRDLADLLARGQSASASGLWGSSVAVVAARVAERAPSVVLCITKGEEEAEALAEDLALFAPRPPLRLVPNEVISADELPASDTLRARLTMALAVVRGEPAPGDAIVAPVQAVLEGVPDAGFLKSHTLKLAPGTALDRDGFLEMLEAAGLERADLVTRPGTFAARGGIVDTFGPDAQAPVRVEFFGDTVESVRTFDIDSQRTVENIDHAQIVLAGEKTLFEAMTEHGTFFPTLLPPDAWIIQVEPLDIQDEARCYLGALDSPRGHFSFRRLLEETRAHPAAFLSVFEESQTAEHHVAFDFENAGVFPREPGKALARVVALAEDGRRVLVFCNNDAERHRMDAMLSGAEAAARARIELVTGRLNHAFVEPREGIACVGHQEIFHRYRRLREVRTGGAARPVESVLDLTHGDLVVHTVRGIARYEGLVTLDRNNGVEEYLTLRFADQARLYVDASRIHLVHKYVGAGRAKPRLSKLTGSEWTNRKARVAEAVGELALSLLATQARRETLPGISFPDDTDWQHEFEASFLYTETEDQNSALGDIKRDMESTRPTDRLICGDVGYGKTELAVRAAFKAAMSGYQTAMLVPTTVLAQQHYVTFSERMADYPVKVEVLSRLRTRGQQRETLERLASGECDIVIGTHRLVQKDVGFKNLGLVVIDEEQRFGVAHKERLKHLRETVNVLTLTATPIPRTLHMALAGLRDVSSLKTPIQDRVAVETHVVRYDRDLIRRAVLRELARQGQVFFVHNRVQSIRAIADELAGIVPEASIVVAHGQMNEHDLEARMLAFIAGDADVLVATTIIESGLDIPNANTIIIHRSDMFGLADLHQLRGRVGRYKHRAYAYFLLPETYPLTDVARERLKAIHDFSHLGAGFRIAERDLEIRGAGNLLGPQQSGHIAAVGYELYCKMLEDAVSRARRGEAPVRAEVEIDLGLVAHLADGYVPADSVRLAAYARLARATRLAELEEAQQELVDRFGPLPPAGLRLLGKHRVRILAAAAGATGVEWTAEGLQVTIPDADLLRAAADLWSPDACIPAARTAVVTLPNEARSNQNVRLARVEKLLARAADGR